MDSTSQLKSWSQAFEEHTVVQTRGIEKQLRSDITQNKQKLRGLVGGSYRELLTTAQQIVTLDTQTSSVEAQISELGRSCKPRQYVSTSQQGTKHSILARLSLLQKCSACIATSLKAGQIILAAKLLAVSRLLHASLSSEQSSPKVLDTIRDQLTRSRQRLLRRIDRRLAEAMINSRELTEVICAFCLATSSSAVDAVRHFQHLRIGHIRQQSQRTGDHASSTFSYYIESLRTTSLLLGRDVPEALRKLQDVAVLKDADVRRLEHLSLSATEKLVPAEIQNYTPYIKRSDLPKEEARRLVISWSETAFQIFVDGLSKSIETFHQTQGIFDLRQQLLKTWLPTCFSVPAHTDVLSLLRATLNQRIGLLIEDQVLEIENFPGDPTGQTKLDHQAAGGENNSGTGASSLWDPDFVTSPLEKGATGFLSRLQTHNLGATDRLRSTSASLQSWCQSIHSLQTSIKSLQQIRWRDIIEEPDEDGEETAENVIRNLTYDDPKSFSEKLISTLHITVSNFQDRIATTATQTSTAPQALFLLRMIRESTLQLSTSFPETSLSKLTNTAPQLHQVLAKEVLHQFSIKMEATSSKTSRPETLPDSLPSPLAFKSLRILCSFMTSVGGIDSWTTPAVKAVKDVVAERIFLEEHQAWYIRNGFDAVYLKTALGRELSAAEREGEEKKTAVEYWNRTRLLFGILEP